MKYLSVKEAAERAGVHEETVRIALRAEELRGVQRVKGGTWRIRPEWVDAWIGMDEAVAA